ncbi:MAG: NTP transferase domain-containing protein, partial [Planctomycetota bacterium]
DRCKATAKLAGASPLRRLLQAGRVWSRADDAPPPLVVSGFHHLEIAEELRGLGNVDLVRNRRWRSGRSGSFVRAIRARRGRDLCLAPVDVPLVPGTVFDALHEAWISAGAPPRGWLAPKNAPVSSGAQGTPRFGHPLVLGRELLEEFSTRVEREGPDMPLRSLRATAEPLLSLEVDSPRILDDLDTPQDLELLRSISTQFSET